MSATTRFYIGFAVALAIVITITLFIGYRLGARHEARIIHAAAAAQHAAARARSIQALTAGAHPTTIP